MKFQKGFLQIYTGNGKGKTTAALGLALRAAGAGLRVYIGQFIKSGTYSELKALKALKKDIVIAQYGRGCFIRGEPCQKDIVLAQKGFDIIKRVLNKCKYDIVILDELCVAIHYKLIPLVDVLEVLKTRPQDVEIVITGRNAPKELLAMADLVTEMGEKKHYYAAGVKARRGIEN